MAKNTFLDLGCGKGRALIVAQEAGFGQVVGVELAEKLARQAERNMKKLKFKNVRVINGDACETQFDAPNLVLYMFNPFGSEIVRHVAANLQNAKEPPLYIIYGNPFHAEPIAELANTRSRTPGRLCGSGNCAPRSPRFDIRGRATARARH